MSTINEKESWQQEPPRQVEIGKYRDFMGMQNNCVFDFYFWLR